MNIESASWQDKLDVLRLMWKNGELSTEKLRDMLARAIDMEFSKADELVDNAFIDACEGLLAELAGDLAHSYKSHKRQNWRAIRRRIGKRETVPQRRLLPAFGLAAVLVIGLIAIEAFLPRGQVDTFSTPDEQQYVVRGETMSVELIGSAMADLVEDELLQLRTKDFDEMCDFLGFRPAVPQYVPDGWELIEYYAAISSTSCHFAVTFTNPLKEHTLSFSFKANSDIEPIAMEYEQNETGDYIALADKKQAYVAHNMEDLLVIWHDDFILYDVNGPITEEEAKAIIASIN